ncbi:phage tail fiber protein [Bordetella bronchiseptica]|uniref:phage tail fiber domain-containing protein n=1 Tax=Bordetella bronchiseptica TaxID=518 RepID=UPI000461F00A|nr:phage tail fiber protein [Bordetella bronchiseptica]KDD18644.1 phage T7 tail fiber protein [Bordetella bronchiseptica MBORD707]
MVAPELRPWIASTGQDGNRYSMQEFAGDGVRTSFEFNFAGGYIDPANVLAYVYVQESGVETPVTPVVLTGPNTIEVTPAVPQGSFLVVYRDTQKNEPLVDFAAGAVMSEENLDMVAKQAVFAAAEMVDRFALTEQAVTDLSGEARAATEVANQALQAAGSAQEQASAAVGTANQALEDVADTKEAAIAATEAANRATAAAIAAEETAGSVQGIADRADENAAQALDIAQAQDGRVQMAIDNSLVAGDVAQNAMVIAEGIDGKAQQALDNSAAAVSAAGEALASAGQAAAVAGEAKTVADAAYPRAGGKITGGIVDVDPPATVGGDTRVKINTQGDYGSYVDFAKGDGSASGVYWRAGRHPGGNFELSRWSGTGTRLDYPFQVVHATGRAEFSTHPIVTDAGQLVSNAEGTTFTAAGSYRYNNGPVWTSSGWGVPIEVDAGRCVRFLAPGAYFGLGASGSALTLFQASGSAGSAAAGIVTFADEVATFRNRIKVGAYTVWDSGNLASPVSAGKQVTYLGALVESATSAGSGGTITLNTGYVVSSLTIINSSGTYAFRLRGYRLQT